MKPARLWFGRDLLLRLAVFALTTLLLLSVATDDAHAQRTTVSIQYPDQVPGDTFFTVEVDVSFSGAKLGYMVGVGIWDPAANDMAPSGASGCSISYRGACGIWVNASSGTVHVTYRVLAPAEPAFWSLVAVAFLANSTFGLVAGSESGSEFMVEVLSPPPVILTVKTPQGVRVIIDGIDQGSGTVKVMLSRGTHVISVSPEIIELDANTRLRFKGWNDTMPFLATRERTMNIKSNTTLGALYVTQYRLEVKGVHVNATGSGWYDEGTFAEFYILDRIPAMEGFLGALGGVWKFKGWSENDRLVTTSFLDNISMDGPHSLEAQWEGDYAFPIAIIGILMVVVAVVAFLIARRGRLRETQLQPSEIPAI